MQKSKLTNKSIVLSCEKFHQLTLYYELVTFKSMTNF